MDDYRCINVPVYVLELISRLRGSKCIRIFLDILDEGTIEEKELVEKYRLTPNNLRKLLQPLYENRIINRYGKLSEGIVFYCVDHGILNNARKRCIKSCEHGCYEKRRYEDRNVNTVACHAVQESELICENYHLMVQYNASLVMRIVYEELPWETYKRKAQTQQAEMSDDVNEWLVVDFVEYMVDLIEDIAPDRTFVPDRKSVRNFIIELKRIFKEHFNGSWKQPVKSYLYKSISTAVKKEKNISIQYMLGTDNVARFIRWYKEQNTVIAKCNYRGIKCKYAENGKCKLIESGGECTDKLLKKMRGLYN